uniref:Uncharacterized protein n=1 Tax=Arundo donax TaxID=35708 RepID=A0A0A9FMF8_ARUDO
MVCGILAHVWAQRVNRNFPCLFCLMLVILFLSLVCGDFWVGWEITLLGNLLLALAVCR